MTTSFILHLNDLMPYGEVAGPAGAMRVAKRKVAFTGGNPVNFEVHTSSRGIFLVRLPIVPGRYRISLC